MPKETRLLPCPFCGYDAVEVISFEVEETQSIEFAVTCQNCSCFGPNDISLERAAEMWNLRRLAHPTDLALVVRLIEGAMPGLSYYEVRQGGRYNDKLDWGEMLAQVAYMTCPKGDGWQPDATIYGMRTPEEWAKWEETFRVPPKEPHDPAQMILTFDEQGKVTA